MVLDGGTQQVIVVGGDVHGYGQLGQDIQRFSVVIEIERLTKVVQFSNNQLLRVWGVVFDGQVLRHLREVRFLFQRVIEPPRPISRYFRTQRQQPVVRSRTY